MVNIDCTRDHSASHSYVSTQQPASSGARRHDVFSLCESFVAEKSVFTVFRCCYDTLSLLALFRRRGSGHCASVFTRTDGAESIGAALLLHAFGTDYDLCNAAGIEKRADVEEPRAFSLSASDLAAERSLRVVWCLRRTLQRSSAVL